MVEKRYESPKSPLTNSKFYTGIQGLFCLPDPKIVNNTTFLSLRHDKLLSEAFY